MMFAKKDLSAWVQKQISIEEHRYANTLNRSVRSIIMRVWLGIKKGGVHQARSSLACKSLPFLRSTETKPFPAGSKDQNWVLEGEIKAGLRKGYMSILRVKKTLLSMMDGGHGGALTLIVKNADQYDQRNKSSQGQNNTYRYFWKLKSKTTTT